MEVRQAVESEEDYAHGIEQAAQHNPDYAVPREKVNSRITLVKWESIA